MSIQHNSYGQPVYRAPGVWMRLVSFINGTSACRVELKVDGEWLCFVGPYTECADLFEGLSK